MANEFIARTGLKVTGSANISGDLISANLSAGSGKVVSIGTGGLITSSGYSLNQDLNTTSTPTFASTTINGTLTVNGTASIAYLNTVFESASVIYSSGSNIFGDASNDTQTLYGTVNVMTGPTNFTGSVRSQAGFTGSLVGTSSWATNATTATNATNLNGQAASYYLNASNINTGTLNNSYLPSAISVTSVSAAFTGNLTGTASYATTALSASYAANVPATASYALQALTASYATTAATAQTTVGTLSQGDGITTFSFNGSTAQTVAVDSTVVRTTGAQTVGGVKTLTSDLILLPSSVQQTVISKQQSTSVGSTITTVAAVTTTNVDAVFFDYVIKQSTTDMRAGTLMVVTNGSTAEYTEYSTLDIGNTSAVTLSADVSGGQVRLRAVAPTGTWTVRALARTI